MIKYLRHNQIDKLRWDDCIGRSLNRRVYAFSWYLDVVCPGWDALVDDDYLRVFPVTHYRKWGVIYLAQPYFAQQLGMFSPDEITGQNLTDFIRAVPERFRFVEIRLNSGNMFEIGEGELSHRTNYELDLSADYETLAGRYAQNTRRNLRKARESGITLHRNGGVEELIGLFRDNFGRKEGKLNRSHYETLKALLHHCIEHNMGYILSAESAEGTLSAGAFFLLDQSRVYFLFAASAPDARENGAMFLLIDRFIADNAGKALTLDFEGGNDPNLGRFYSSFGAAGVSYPAIRINRLSKVADLGLYFIRKLRK
jgi:hypothetical protein